MGKTTARGVLATRWFAGFVTALVLVAVLASAAVWARGAGSTGGPAMSIRMQLPDPGSPRGGGEWIELDSFSWGMSNSGSSPTGRTVSTSEIIVTKVVDASSARLANACCNAEDPFPEVIIEMCRGSCDTGTVYMQYTLKGAFITKYSLGGSSEGSLPTETISFNYTEIKWVYMPQKDGGQSGGLTCPGYDLKNCTK